MERGRLYAALSGLVPEGDLLKDEPMDRHTSFRAGGQAGFLVLIRDTDTLRKVLCLLKGEGVPFLVLGKGTNVLVSDRGYPGVLIQLTGPAFEAVEVSETDGCLTLTAGCAAKVSALSLSAAKAGIAGFVPLSGIPGSVGGALAMNAGAYGGEMKDVVKEVRALDADLETVPEVTLPLSDLHLAYRRSVLSERNLVFLSASFRTDRREDPEALEAQMKELSATRREKQPLDFPSAGSTFKRPEGAFAAKLIEDAGLKGCSVGGAQVSEKHAGFVINRGGATATDILCLMRRVRERVKETSGITLEPEVLILGEEL